MTENKGKTRDEKIKEIQRNIERNKGTRERTKIVLDNPNTISEKIKKLYESWIKRIRY